MTARSTSRWLLAAFVGALLMTPTGAAAQDIPEFSPPDVEPTEEEISYYESIVACPEIADHTVSEPSVFAQAFNFSLSCQYRRTDPPGPAGSLSLRWSRPTTGGECNASPAVGAQRTGIVNGSDGDPALAAVVGYTLDDETDEPTFVAAAETLLAMAAPLAPRCPEEPIEISCPSLAGYAATDPSSGGGARYSANCFYSGDELPNVELVGIWAIEFGTDHDSLVWLCSDPERFIDGDGQVRVDGQAALVRFSISSLTPIDTAPIIAASRDIATQLSTQAQSCEGVEIVEFESIFSAIPPYLAGVFSAELTMSSPPPGPSDAGGDAGGSTVAGQSPFSGGATSGGSGGTSLLRILSVVMLVLSVLGLILTFVLVRRPSRIRPKYDVIRIVAIVAVAISSALVFSRAAPLAAIGGAIALGAALGVLQGRSLTMSKKEKGIYSQRSGLAIVAFGAGVVVTQIAGLAQRSGAINLGIALSFFSAAIATGLLVGRHPNLRAARSTGVAGPLALVAVATVLLGVAGPHARAQNDPAGEATLATNATLIDVVDWDLIQIQGGLYANFAKPFTELSVPVGFADIPAPITNTVEWTVLGDDGLVMVASPNDFSVTETFTFAARSDGLCCAVDYSGTGSRTRDSGGEEVVETLEADARLGDIQALAIDGEPGAFRFASDLSLPPFGETETFRTGGSGPDQCGRRVAGVRDADDLAETGGEVVFRSASRDGEVVDQVSLGAALLVAPCDLPGYTLEAAIAAAPPAPADSPCPLRRDLYAALESASTLPGVDTATLNDLFYEPNVAECDVGALLAPPSFGQGGRGNQRHEIVVDFIEPSKGEWDLGYDRWFTNDRVLGLVSTFPHPAGFDRCEIDANGVAVNPGPDGSCFYETLHEMGDDLYVTISIDYSFFDGPNTTIWARTSWGTYNYRCHHCTPGDPAIATFLEGLHQFGTDWANGRYGDGEIGVQPGSQADQVDPAAVAAGTSDDDDGLSDEQAALGALLGLLGVSAVAITSLLESGGTLADVLEAAERDGDDGGPSPDQPPQGGVRDENGEWMVPDGDGMYDWGGVPLSREDVEERIRDQRQANTDRDRRIGDITRDQTGDAAAAERFAGLAGRTRAADDALRAEIREGRRRMADAETWAERRQAALDRLEAADAERAAADDAWWSEVIDDTKGGALTDVESLRGFGQDVGTAIRDGLGSAFDTAVDVLTDPESYRTVLETGVETAWDLAGMTVGGGSFGDGAQSLRDAGEAVAEPVRIVLETGAETVWDLAGVTIGGGSFGDGAQSIGDAVEYVAEDPVGFVVAVTPLQSFANAIDGDIPLGNRLGWLGLGVVDVGMTLSGFGFGDAAVDAVRAADAVADTARVLDTAVDATRGSAVVADALLSPELVATRNRINNALLRAQQEAAWRGVPVQQVLRDLPEARALFQDGVGMGRMAALEAAGGLSDEVASAVVAMHDEITGVASRIGAENAIDDMMRAHGVRPQQVMVGNSGSTGLGRSVMTDADRTLVTVFSDSDVDLWVARNPGMSRAQAAEDMQATFARAHQRQMELALNSSTDPAVVLARDTGMDLGEAVAHLQRTGLDDEAAAAARLNRGQMDHASYGGIGSTSGQADSYATNYTSARQSRGSTEVMTVDAAGGINSYSTSGDALLEQIELERFRHTGSVSYVDVAGAEVDGVMRWHDPTRIPLSEVGPLLGQQVKAVSTYSDVKSVAKAADRARYLAARMGTELSDPKLARAASAIRANPNSTAAVLTELGMSERQFVEANRAMVIDLGNRLAL